jgi:hypothetical protein
LGLASRNEAERRNVEDDESLETNADTPDRELLNNKNADKVFIID